MMQDCTVKINGEDWDIRFVSRRDMPKRKWGLCVYSTHTILVRNDLSYENIVDTLIHEVLHAQRLHESESFVNRTATEITTALSLSGLIGN